MKRYSAKYKDARGMIRLEFAAAVDWRAVHLKLPRWIYPNGVKFTRITSPRLDTSDNQWGDIPTDKRGPSPAVLYRKPKQ